MAGHGGCDWTPGVKGLGGGGGGKKGLGAKTFKLVYLFEVYRLNFHTKRYIKGYFTNARASSSRFIVTLIFGRGCTTYFHNSVTLIVCKNVFENKKGFD